MSVSDISALRRCSTGAASSLLAKRQDRLRGADVQITCISNRVRAMYLQ